MKASTVVSNGKKIQTLDNPINLWVRDVQTGKLAINDKIQSCRSK